MPIYEYRCESCGHQLEAIQKFSDPVLSECPSCGQAGLKKLLSASGFQLKGSGWYASDSKGGAGSKKSDGDAGGSSGSDGGQKHGCGGGTCGGCAH